MWNCMTSFLIILVSIKRCHPLNCTDNGYNRCFYSQYPNNELQTHHQIVPLPEMVFATSNTLSPPKIVTTHTAEAVTTHSIRLSNEFSRNSRMYSDSKKIFKRESLSMQNATQKQGSNNKNNNNNNTTDSVFMMNSEIHVATSFFENDTIAEIDVFDSANSTTNMTIQDEPCDEHEDVNCIIDHTQVCVGDPRYCNLTYDQYMELLSDYITPTISEWILIVSHFIVFVMGLVSDLI